MKKAATDPTPPKSRKSATTTNDAKPPDPKSRKTSKPSAPITHEATPAGAAPIEAAPPVRAPVSAPESTSLTVVAARVDIGFGNLLYLRGFGPGLDWDVGTPMTNAGSDLWTIDLMGARAPVCCKFLINDIIWSAGPDYVIEAGAQLEVTPLF